MKFRRLLAVAIMVVATIGLVPSTASAECYDNTGIGVVDDKILYDTCTGCGYVKIRGKLIYLFPCGP